MATQQETIGYGTASATSWGGAGGSLQLLGFYGLLVFKDIWKFTTTNDNPPANQQVSANNPPTYYISSADAGL